MFENARRGAYTYFFFHLQIKKINIGTNYIFIGYLNIFNKNVYILYSFNYFKKYTY